MLRDALFLTEPPYGQPAALLRRDAFAPLIVFGDPLLVHNTFGHETTMQLCRTFGKRGSSAAYPSTASGRELALYAHLLLVAQSGRRAGSANSNEAPPQTDEVYF